MSMSATPLCFAARNTCRPILPNPLIPTRKAISISSWLPPVAEGGRPAEGHKTNNACTAIAERGSARVQSRRGRDDVVDKHDMGAAERVSRRQRHAKRARNVAEAVPWCQPSLCLGVTRADERVAPHGHVDAGAERTRQLGALIVAALLESLARQRHGDESRALFEHVQRPVEARHAL